MKFWGIIAAIVVVGLAAWWWLGASRIPRVDPAHEQRAAEKEQQVDQTDAAIRGRSAEIARIRAEADRQGQARAQAEQRAAAFAGRAAELGQQVTRLEAAAKARPLIDSRARALQVLHEMGYR